MRRLALACVAVATATVSWFTLRRRWRRLARWEATAARHRLKAERRRVKRLMQTPWSDEAGGLRVAIDIGMESLMSDGELASLATQVMLSYAFVVKRCVAQNWRPLRLALTNTDAAAATLARIRDAASAEIGDAWPVKVVGSDFATGLPALCAPSDAPQIVVLSPDADTPLTTLDPGAVYVIGGLCDYRRIANATRDRARERGVCCRRLPLQEALGAKLPVEILTVDQVVQILLHCSNTGDWVGAFEAAVPPRKLRAVGR